MDKIKERFEYLEELFENEEETLEFFNKQEIGDISIAELIGATIGFTCGVSPDVLKKRINEFDSPESLEKVVDQLFTESEQQSNIEKVS